MSSEAAATNFPISDTGSGKEAAHQPETITTINDFAARIGIPNAGWSKLFTRIVFDTRTGRHLNVDEASDAEAAGESLGAFVTTIAWSALPIEQHGAVEGSTSSFTLQSAEKIITIEAAGKVWVREFADAVSDVGWALRYTASIEPDVQSSL